MEMTHRNKQLKFLQGQSPGRHKIYTQAGCGMWYYIELHTDFTRSQEYRCSLESAVPTRDLQALL